MDKRQLKILSERCDRMDELLARKPEEEIQDLYDLPIKTAEARLKELGYTRIDDLAESFPDDGEVTVWEKTVGGDGIGEIPYIYIAAEEKIVTFINTGPTPNEALEVLMGNVKKVARQAAVS